ncbi:MAG TPA: hypothetical protein VFW00_05505, partial [Rhodocyclaceae bacterium]|nr:hypothetical protein [Rhodocyclaceae bacterium]
MHVVFATARAPARVAASTPPPAPPPVPAATPTMTAASSQQLADIEPKTTVNSIPDSANNSVAKPATTATDTTVIATAPQAGKPIDVTTTTIPSPTLAPTPGPVITAVVPSDATILAVPDVPSVRMQTTAEQSAPSTKIETPAPSDTSD